MYCTLLMQIVTMVEMCGWTDRLVELQLWTRLAYIAFENRNHEVVCKCASQALKFAQQGTQPKGKKPDG